MRERFIRLGFAVFASGVIILVLLFVAEAVLTFAAPKRKAPLPEFVPYAEFTKQHLHPFYYFFFPQDMAEIARINNAVVSIDGRGFRGALPEERAGKKLAFLVGGSAAFGEGSSDNNTTISGYLNQAQSEYLFVNAGVPSWVSTQEFYRVALELLDYQPDLVAAYDGFNDGITAYSYAVSGFGYPAGTPESYNGLRQKFDDIREQKLVTVNKARLSKYLLFHLRQRLKARLSAEKPPVTELGGELKTAAAGAARAYLHNLELMRDVSERRGAKFIAIYQPWLYGIENPSAADRSVEFLRYFHDQVFQNKPADLPLLDWSEKISNPGVFLDQVHLSDEGNRAAAAAISGLVIKK